MNTKQNISIINSLKSAKISPSFVRIQVLKFLRENPVHPTADMIYKSLVSFIPTLSRTSVYNSLDLFVDKKLVNEVHTDSGEMRYDGSIEEHGHFKCEKCEQIYDFNVDFKFVKLTELSNFKITHRDILIFGLCPKCVKKQKEEAKK
jgi:Fur family peroxide stress response transcriptional regulator